MAREEYFGCMRYLSDEPETDEEEVEEDDEPDEEEEDEDEVEEDAETIIAMNQSANEQMARLCGLEETDPLQRILQRTWDAMQKGAVTLVILMFLVSGAWADSLTESQIAGQLEQGVIPLAVGVGDELALNLMNAQIVNISYTANEPTSLQLSIDAVLKAISIYDWLGGPTLITDAQAEPIVWAQSNMAIDTGASVSLTPTSINFGNTPISTPEPSTLWMLLPLALVGLRLAFTRRK